MPVLLNKAGRAVRALLPSGLRRVFFRLQLKRRFHLADLGTEFDYFIASNNRFGKGCRLGGPVYISGSEIGDYTYIELGSRISGANIGKFCAIAPYALVGLAEHPARKFVSTHPMFYRHIPEFGYDLVDKDEHQELSRTYIGNDVWIGAGACIRGGVNVGHGAVIGAGAVVTKDVPPYAVYGGIPARLIRHRFDPEQISFLLELKWWDRDADWLIKHVSEFQDINILMGRLPAQ